MRQGALRGGGPGQYRRHGERYGSMRDVPAGRRTVSCVVIGAGGGIGSALVQALEQRGQRVIGLGRHTVPRLDLRDEASIAAAAAFVGPGVRLAIDATGFLHGAGFQPEKALRQLDPAHLAHSFAINATGPALLMKHFLPLLARDERSVFATLSARVGSIEDNRLGGWFSYRAAKAALNQIMRGAAIELARTRPGAICVALHPGTVDTALSAPFAKAGLEVRPAPAPAAAAALLAVIDSLGPAQTGLLLDQHGKVIPF